ncbi:hypothetical protein [Pseudomonas baetica]|uniref:hypothetical protein n=1 Tax=Pseudomonas baetica TaxID=674054 RepID=UPI00240514EA|nr:hypothetical protein [Pseudomonas baetica]MDF9778999.1 hypothetical protein [Pseudomonas baetica]
MSNPLYVTLTEFKTRGSDEVLVGYIANDNDNESVYRVASTWEAFKAQFPSREAILQQLEGESAFYGLSGTYHVVNGEIEVIEDDEESVGFSSIIFEGDDDLF